MAEPTKVFLSYGREDEVEAERLYERLLEDGLRPWMSGRDILPGENWACEINARLAGFAFGMAQKFRKDSLAAISMEDARKFRTETRMIDELNRVSSYAEGTREVNIGVEVLKDLLRKDILSVLRSPE
jgi:hypothetical protein